MRFRPSKARRLLDLKAWTELPFFLTGLCFFMLFLGVDIPAFYVQLYGIKEGILNDNLSSYILPILNTGSFFGRIVSIVYLQSFQLNPRLKFCRFPPTLQIKLVCSIQLAFASLWLEFLDFCG